MHAPGMQSNSIVAGKGQATVKRGPISAVTNGGSVLAAVAGKQCRILGIVAALSAAGTVKFQTAAGATDVSGVFTNGLSLGESARGWMESGVNQAITVVITGGGTLSGVLIWAEV